MLSTCQCQCQVIEGHHMKESNKYCLTLNAPFGTWNALVAFRLHLTPTLDCGQGQC